MQPTEGWDVDFVVGPGDAGDEELLPEPAQRPLWRNSLLIGALAIALALLVVGGVRLTGRHTPAPRATPQAHAPVLPHHHPQVVFGGPAIAAHLGPEPAVIDAPSRLRVCPDRGNPFPSCSIVYRLPRAVREALRDHLPLADHVHGFEEQIHYVGYEPGGLLYRQVYARIRGVKLAITVARKRIPQPIKVLLLPQYVGFTFHRTGFYVRTIVHVHGPQLIPSLRLMALTRDPRLRAGE